MSNNYIKRLIQLSLINGITINDADMKMQLALCESCMYSKFTRNSFFKKYEVERRVRYKIAKAEAKKFKTLKHKEPYNTQAEKYGKYPDEPLSEFEEYSKSDMNAEDCDTDSKFVKVKNNPLQNNLIGDLYGYIAVDLKGPFNIPGFNGEKYLMAFIDAKASMQTELYYIY